MNAFTSLIGKSNWTKLNLYFYYLQEIYLKIKWRPKVERKGEGIYFNELILTKDKHK